MKANNEGLDEVYAYLDRVKKIPSLTRAQEQATWRRYLRSGRKTVWAKRLIEPELKGVVYRALKFRGYGFPVGDLVAEGNLGLYHALSKFEPDRGIRFHSYAEHWVRAYILKYILRNWSLVSTGGGSPQTHHFFKLRRERNRLLSILGDHEAALNALSDQLGMARERVTDLLSRIDQRDFSLDVPVQEDQESTTMKDVLPSDFDLEGATASNEIQERLEVVIEDIVSRLPEREQAIVRDRFMRSKDEQRTLGEIGEAYGVSRERIRQVEARLKGKIRRELIRVWRSSGGELFDYEAPAAEAASA